MKPATRILHLALIRAIRSALAAWEGWLNTEGNVPGKPPVTNDPPRVDTHR